MDATSRDLERTATLEGGLEALLRGVRARRRAEGDQPLPGERDAVGGAPLAGLLRAALDSTGRREVELLRAAGVSERRVGDRIASLRALTRHGRSVLWPVVREWAGLLGLDLGDVVAVAEVTPEPPPPPPPPPHPPLPAECCGRCTRIIWAVGCGGGVRCGHAESPLGRGGMITNLRFVCPGFLPRSGPSPWD